MRVEIFILSEGLFHEGLRDAVILGHLNHCGHLFFSDIGVVFCFEFVKKILRIFTFFHEIDYLKSVIILINIFMVNSDALRFINFLITTSFRRVSLPIVIPHQEVIPPLIIILFLKVIIFLLKVMSVLIKRFFNFVEFFGILFLFEKKIIVFSFQFKWIKFYISR